MFTRIKVMSYNDRYYCHKIKLVTLNFLHLTYFVQFVYILNGIWLRKGKDRDCSLKIPISLVFYSNYLKFMYKMRDSKDYYLHKNTHFNSLSSLKANHLKRDHIWQVTFDFKLHHFFTSKVMQLNLKMTILMVSCSYWLFWSAALD